MMISEYLNKTQINDFSRSSNFDFNKSSNHNMRTKKAYSKPYKSKLIYQNVRNSTGMNFNKKKKNAFMINDFVNKDIRSISMPYDGAAKSSENINKPKYS